LVEISKAGEKGNRFDGPPKDSVGWAFEKPTSSDAFRNRDMDVWHGGNPRTEVHTLRCCGHDGLQAWMRQLAACCLLAVATIATAEDTAESAADQSVAEQAPYIVFVSKSCYARCGPGADYYRTDQLKPGHELEVYVETDDGWLGIRPPQGSFCWLPADATDATESDTVAKIRDDECVVWIGTQLGKAKKYRWQVKLNAGEQISIIDRAERQGKDGPRTWFRIVPPSGEFRWVHRDQVVETAEDLAAKLVESAKQSAPTVAPVPGEETSGDAVVLQTSNLEAEDRTSKSTDPRSEDADPPSRLASSRRDAGTLKEASEIPDFEPVPRQAIGRGEGPASTRIAGQEDVPDRMLQFHRGADPEAFEDRGAVIGSGLRREWRRDLTEVDPRKRDVEGNPAEGRSVLDDGPLETLPASGAAAAAAAIAEPFRRVSDVVASFVSPPRLVEIDPNRNQFSPERSLADQRWTVGANRTLNPSRLPLPPRSSLAGTPTPSANESALGNQSSPSQTGIAPASFQTSVEPSGRSGLGMPIPRSPAAPPRGRVVTTAQISRVEDAVANADLETLARVLSKLMAEAASADEMDPLIRRIETVMQSGDIANANRLREMMQRAQQYRNLAAKRDGSVTIRTTAYADSIGNRANELQASAQSAATMAPSTNADSFNPVPLLSNPPTSAEAISGSSLPATPKAGTAVGYLVQVYSARAESPPFALTDDAGLTVAYVTPYPGVNLRNHLNSRVAVRGTEKLLRGMSTPHILVDNVQRR
jgi:SH3-like domain-containing protein